MKVIQDQHQDPNQGQNQSQQSKLDLRTTVPPGTTPSDGLVAVKNQNKLPPLKKLNKKTKKKKKKRSLSRRRIRKKRMKKKMKATPGTTQSDGSQVELTMKKPLLKPNQTAKKRPLSEYETEQTDNIY